jgi:hypothetical protein
MPQPKTQPDEETGSISFKIKGNSLELDLLTVSMEEMEFVEDEVGMPWLQALWAVETGRMKAISRLAAVALKRANPSWGWGDALEHIRPLVPGQDFEADLGGGADEEEVPPTDESANAVTASSKSGRRSSPASTASGRGSSSD